MKDESISAEFMREVQSAGWNIVAVTTDAITAGCPRSGCNLRHKIRKGGTVPAVCRTDPPLADVAVTSFDDARIAMRERREQLWLTIKEVEDAAGLADDYLAKFEKDDPSKIPNAQAFIEWVQSLGFEMVLRPSTLPPRTMRLIEQTRVRGERRLASFRHFGRIRKGRASAE